MPTVAGIFGHPCQNYSGGGHVVTQCQLWYFVLTNFLPHCESLMGFRLSYGLLWLCQSCQTEFHDTIAEPGLSIDDPCPLMALGNKNKNTNKIEVSAWSPLPTMINGSSLKFRHQKNPENLEIPVHLPTFFFQNSTVSSWFPSGVGFLCFENNLLELYTMVQRVKFEKWTMSTPGSLTSSGAANQLLMS